MKAVAGLTAAQARFLKRFKKLAAKEEENGKQKEQAKKPEGRPGKGQDSKAMDWPGTAVLEQWMRQKEFRRRLEGLARAAWQEIRMHLLGRAVAAARRVAETGRAGAENEGKPIARECMDVIRLTLTAERAAGMSTRTKGPQKGEQEEELSFEELAGRLAHPEANREEVIRFIRERAGGGP